MNHIQIPYENLKEVNRPYFKSLLNAAEETINSGWYILGDSVERFEKEYSAIHKSDYCLGVASGLDALILGLSVFGFPKDSKVLVPSNTYIASILAIIRSGLQPVLVEPDPLTYTITVEGLEKKYDKTCVAILPVHLYGRLCSMKEIISFAKLKNLKVIEDCAQAHFAESDGKMAGTFGDIGAFSFYPTKNLGALGDAGAILCQDGDVYSKLKALRNYGSQKKYHNDFIGWNSRLDELQASFLLAKLFDYKNVIKHKRKLASIYLDHLSDIEQIKLPHISGNDHVWHIFNILVENRDFLRDKLFELGVGTEVHYPIPPNHQIGYRQYFAEEECLISEHIHRQTISLPISTIHTESDIFRVVANIRTILS